MTEYNGEPVLGKDPRLISVSNSEVQTYKECRRKWWLTYYRGLTPRLKKTTGPLAIGTRVHAALEAYYTDGRSPVDVHAELYRADLEKLQAEEFDTTDLEKDGDLGRIMLEGYIEWLEETGADAGLEVVGAETKVTTMLAGGRVELRGKLDMRVKRKADGVRLFMDHKTAQNFSDVSRIAHMNEQLMTYQLLEATQADEAARCDGGIFNILRKVKRTASAKPPFYDRIEVRHNKHTMRAFWSRLHGTLFDMLRTRKALDEGIDHTSVAYPSPTRDCTWKCDFFAVCPMFDDGSAAEQLLEDLYDIGNPYDRYNDKKEGAA